MLRYACFILFIGVIALKTSTTDAQSLLGKENNPVEILGEATNGLQPRLLIEKYGSDWSVEIDLYARTNFEKNAWLKITNRVGSKLQLWLTNGIELQLTNSSILAAMNLPSQTTVSNIMRGVHPSNKRGLQWWPVVGHGVAAGESYTAAGFSLQSDFDISFTNDVMLQITPLIYKVETNEVMAHLTEFPPIKMKLLSNGKVQKLP
ncbi:MAG: hypothetical protein ABSH15_16520 [Verrucomicrobiota bacterium]|jgi:hypothetical protein